MSSIDSQDIGQQHGSASVGSTDPSGSAVVPVDAVASVLTETVPIPTPPVQDQAQSAPDRTQVQQGQFSSPSRGRGSSRGGRFRGSAMNPHDFFDLHARGGRGRFSSTRAPWESNIINNSSNQNKSMEFDATNDIMSYNNNFPALPTQQQTAQSSINS
jgi:hypothetical protein